MTTPFPLSRARLRRGAAAAVTVVALGLAGAVVPADAAAGTAFSPTALAWDAPEQPNPLRGQYLWHPGPTATAVPAGTLSATDSYARYNWNTLEPERGHYDFTAIETELRRARDRGGRFAFRVMPLCQACSGNAEGVSVPPDLATDVHSWTFAAVDGPMRVPDWNDPYYLQRWEELWTALGMRFGSDPRLAYVDVGGYGNWGEMHNFPQRTDPATGRREGSVATVQAIIDSVVRHMPGPYVELNTPTMVDARGDYDGDAEYAVVSHAMGASRRVGMRNDCVGGGGVQWSALAMWDDLAERSAADPVELRPMERWRTAPLVTEWCNNIQPPTAPAWDRPGTFAQGRDQVYAYHFATLSSANFGGPWQDYGPTEKAAFLEANRHAGYRYRTSSVSVSTPVVGCAVDVAADVVNDGVAPTYDDWALEYRLVDSAGAVVARGSGALDLRSVVSAGVAGHDSARLTAPAAGRYGLRVVVTDRTGYSAPLRLAQQGRGGDGSFDLGEVTVASGSCAGGSPGGAAGQSGAGSLGSVGSLGSLAGR